MSRAIVRKPPGGKIRRITGDSTKEVPRTLKPSNIPGILIQIPWPRISLIVPIMKSTRVNPIPAPSPSIKERCVGFL